MIEFLKKLTHLDSRWHWIALGLVAIVLRYLLGFFPQFIETYYSRGLFSGIRQVIDNTLAFSPVPLIYLFFAIAIFILLRGLIKPWRRQGTVVSKTLQSLFSLAAFTAGLIFFFLLLWGFNYGRVPLEQQLGFAPTPLSQEELMAELQRETAELIDVRKRIPGATDEALTASSLPQHLQVSVRQLQEHTMSSLGFPVSGKVQSRMLFPKGILLRISTAGFYLPFTGESNIDAGLHPIQLPFVMAHEYAHGYGITDEGSCNFLGFLACENAADPFIRYSGHYGYWRYLLSSFRLQNPEAYKTFREALPAGIKADIKAISENSDKYPDIFPKFRDLTYDAFLKAQGINDGMANYNRIVLLVNGWRKKKEG